MIPVKVFRTSFSIPIPEYATPGAAAMDIFTPERVYLYPNTVTKIPTGLFVEIPKGWQLNIYSRSGLAAIGISVANQPAIIDSDYRGEICVLLDATGISDSYVLEAGSRIAQMQLNPVYLVGWNIVDRLEDLSTTQRGQGGFGSTGQ